MQRITNRTSRRAPPLKDSDFDHEIRLFDNAADDDDDGDDDGFGDDSGGGRSRLAPPPVTITAATDEGDGGGIQVSEPAVQPVMTGATLVPTPTGSSSAALLAKTGSGSRVSMGSMGSTGSTGSAWAERRGRGRPSLQQADGRGVETASAVDVLYENERGCILCGIALFSARALGNLDPSPWTNAAGKTSPTDIRTAQVPDPSWQWAWPAWRVNHDDGTDDDGWEYSFMFARVFSWHGPAWYSSFVRRRVWTRKRVKRTAAAAAAAVSAAAAAGTPADASSDGLADPQLLNPDYFVVLPATGARRSPSRGSRTARSSLDTTRTGAGGDGRGNGSGGNGSGSAPIQLDGASQDDGSGGQDDDEGQDDEGQDDEGIATLPEVIDSADTLMHFLHGARIDREKIEAVDRYLLQAGEDLVRLQDVMHEVMAQFVFQAPRRILLTHLTAAYDAAVEARDKETGTGADQADGDVHRLQALGRRVGYLAAAVRHADEEVRRLEYWSDVRAMAQSGDVAGSRPAGRPAEAEEASV